MKVGALHAYDIQHRLVETRAFFSETTDARAIPQPGDGLLRRLESFLIIALLNVHRCEPHRHAAQNFEDNEQISGFFT